MNEMVASINVCVHYTYEWNLKWIAPCNVSLTLTRFISHGGNFTHTYIHQVIHHHLHVNYSLRDRSLKFVLFKMWNLFDKKPGYSFWEQDPSLCWSRCGPSYLFTRRIIELFVKNHHLGELLRILSDRVEFLKKISLPRWHKSNQWYTDPTVRNLAPLTQITGASKEWIKTKLWKSINIIYFQWVHRQQFFPSSW